MIKCPNCGGELKFKPKDKVIKCEYCYSSFKASELKEQVKSAKSVEVSPNGTTKATSYECSQCGGTLLTFDETAVTFCSYCGSQAMLKPKMVDVNNPDYIIPFKLTKEDCIERYKRKINSALFAPSYMKDDIVVEKFRGIYMPYAIYKFSFHGTSSSYGKKYTHHWMGYDYYNNYSLRAKLDYDYEGISYDLVSKLFDKYTHHIPYNFKEVEPFNFNYLAGYYADAKDISSDLYVDEAKAIVKEDCKKRMRRHPSYRFHGCYNPSVGSMIVDKKVGMFPVYFLSVRDKDKSYIHYAVINGQTGDVAMDIPIDFKKYLLASVIMSILIYLVVRDIVFILPAFITILGLISLITSWVISFRQTSKIEAAQNHHDDKGFNYINSMQVNRTRKAFTGIKSYHIKYIVGLVIALIVLFTKPVMDYYYYGAAIIDFLISIWSFYELVKERNLLISNKLPQLEARGGDEHA